jgi:hypothetical protein
MENTKYLLLSIFLVFGFPFFATSQSLDEQLQAETGLTILLPEKASKFTLESPKVALIYKSFGISESYKLDDENVLKSPTLAPFKRPFPSMVYSAVIPGSAQAVHGKWVRAGVYAAIEVVGIMRNIHHNNKAKRLEQQYYDYVDQNWSVVNYANWLIGYNQYYGNNAGLLDVWRPGAAQNPTYTNSMDWGQVDLEKLRQLERNSIYLTTLPGGGIQRDLAFSHVVQDFGSQQYYELASKYFQFAPGWRDFNVMSTAEDIGRIQWNVDTISSLSGMWLEGSLQADRFNTQYRTASNWISLLMMNHIISAFDGYFTAKLAGNNLKLQAPVARNELFTLRLEF